MTSSRRFFMGAVPVDPCTLDEAVDLIDALVEAGNGGAVYTPNVDHVMLAEHHNDFRAAYAQADFCPPDGKPVVWGARMLGHEVPERVSGADLLLPVLVRAAKRDQGVYFFGANETTLRLAQDKLAAQTPHLRIVGQASPMVDPSASDAAYEEWCAPMRASGAKLIIVALGAPKQELFIARARAMVPGAVFLAFGAALEFVAGTVPRAPVWMRGVGLEWAYRLGREPRRLAHRYLVRDAGYPRVLWREWRKRR